MKDSIDKIVTSYFNSVSSQQFVYKNKVYYPKDIRISPLILRGFDCPENCGACCNLNFSLDYLPEPLEKHPYQLTERIILFNNQKFLIYSDLQTDNNTRHCKNLDIVNGRCKIHGEHPFSCDFELLRFLNFKSKSIPNLITNKPYGRGWNLLKCNNERGALCKMTKIQELNKNEVTRKLNRLAVWCDYFKLEHKINYIIEQVNSIKIQSLLF